MVGLNADRPKDARGAAVSGQEMGVGNGIAVERKAQSRERLTIHRETPPPPRVIERVVERRVPVPFPLEMGGSFFNYSGALLRPGYYPGFGSGAAIGYSVVATVHQYGGVAMPELVEAEPKRARKPRKGAQDALSREGL